MLVALIIFVVIIALVVGLLFSRAELEVKYERRGADDRITIIINSPFGVVYQRTEVPVLEFDKGKDGWHFDLQTSAKEEIGNAPTAYTKTEFYFQELDKVKYFIRRIKESKKTLSPVVDFILDHVRVRSVTWQTTVGTGDAALTAFICGSLWGAKGTLLSFMQRRVDVVDSGVIIAVFPSFKQPHFQTFLQCIFSLRVVHIITAQLILFREKRRYKKGVSRDG